MKEAQKFKNNTEYSSWCENFENPSEYQEFPIIIDDGFKISMDMFTECKSWKWALKRFNKAFESIITPESISDFLSWIECIRESCEYGHFSEAYVESSNSIHKDMYSWGIENVSENCWYIYLNISGIYAGRDIIY